MPIQEGGTFAPTQNIVSPGVFTRENDLSALAQGVANIGGAIVAPFADGPAFFPATISELSTLEGTFGLADGVYYGPYTAKEYLQQQGIVTVVRVGGLTGYWQKNPLIIYAQPGEWVRDGDRGAITDSSFMYLDSNSYTTNLQYQQSSSVLLSSGSNTNNKNEIRNISSYVTVARATNSEINAFLNTISGLPYVGTLSQSLQQSSSLGKVFKISTQNYYTAFSASVVRRNKKLGSTDGYSLAAFDFEKSRFSGSLSQSATTLSLIFDTNTFGNIAGSQNNAPKYSTKPYYSYLTSSYILNGSNITYGLVFAKCPGNQTTNFSTATYNLAKSTGSYEFRYDNSRLFLSGPINITFGSTPGTTNINTASLTGADNLTGSVLYSGRQLDIGSIGPIKFTRKNVDNSSYPYFYLTSSIQGQSIDSETALSEAFAESSTTVAYFSSSLFGTSTGNVSIDYNQDVINVGSNGLKYVSGSFASIRGVGTCEASLQLKGIISGAFGKYNGSFINNDNSSNDQCNPNTDGRQKLILAILANTQNASTQFSSDYEVYGFNGTTLSQLTSSVYPYKNVIDPNENVYNLALKYSFVNSAGGTNSGTYGYYDFSLNENDNNYIKDVFGIDPTVGNPSKQIAGQKVEAAYNYVLFEDSIKKFVAEKTSTLGWRLLVGTNTLSGSSIVGEPLKFVDQYSTNLNAGDSQFAITNATTPWIYSQKIAPLKLPSLRVCTLNSNYLEYTL